MNLADIKFTWLPHTNAVGTKNNKGLPPTNGRIYNIYDLDDYIKDFSGTSEKCLENPCIMAINTGVRTSVDDITPEMFSNVVFVDIDHIAGKVNVDIILDDFIKMCNDIPQLLAAQKSNSGNLHFIFLDNEFTTQEEYKKTARFYLCLIVYYIGKKYDIHIEDIKGSMDDSMTSISHLMKITKNHFYYNPYCCFAHVPDKLIKEIQNYFPNMFIERKLERPDCNGHVFKYSISDSNYSDYYPHLGRMQLYHDCMIATNFDKDKADDLFVKYIAPNLKEDHGHTIEFYKKEPDIDKWFKYISEKWTNNGVSEELAKFGIIAIDETVEDIMENLTEKFVIDLLNKWQK